jgi:steroid 5-alpha reductase family enzyme
VSFPWSLVLDAMFLGLLPMLAIATVGWLYSIWADEVSIVSPLWPFMVLTSVFTYASFFETEGGLLLSVQVMVGLWALRMGYFLFMRNINRPEERQYRVMRQQTHSMFHIKSLFLIFYGHVFSAWIASWLFIVVCYHITTGTLAWTIYQNIAIGLWAIGLLVQSIADYQLYRYSRDVQGVGGTYGRGLWRYSRHPNYFAECFIWWSWCLFALPTGNILAIISPAFMTYLMVKVKADRAIEEEIASRRKDYKKYISATSFMVPWRSKF